MAIIELSDGLRKLAGKKVANSFKGTSENRGFLYFMKGQPPSSLDNVFSPSNYRTEDRLVRWNSSQTTIINSTVISTSSSPAIRSGQATWFYWYRVTDVEIYQLAGTISKTNDGGDIELSNTKITASKTYNFSDLEFSFNKTYFYTLTTEPTTPSPEPSPPPPPQPTITVFPQSAVWYVGNIL